MLCCIGIDNFRNYYHKCDYLGGIVLKRVFFIMMAVTLLLTGCSKPEGNNKIKADNITIFYSISSHAMFGANQAIIDDLLNQFNSLSFEKTTDEMDAGSSFIVYFSYNGNAVKHFWVDKNGVFWLDGKTQSFKVSSGSFDYQHLKAIYEGSKNIPLETALPVDTPKVSKFTEQKIYEISSKQQKGNYSVNNFKHFYTEYLKLNNIELSTSPENDKTEMSKDDKLKYYTIYDITPNNVKEEIGCQIFKVNYTCETYVVYKSKVYAVGLGFGGYGLLNIDTCDFDNDGQKDLIYTFSWGSGLHRSHIGVFNFAKEKEEWLDFQQMNEDIMLEKLSDNNFKIYIAKVSSENSDFIHFKLSKQEQVADVKSVDGKVEVILNLE